MPTVAQLDHTSTPGSRNGEGSAAPLLVDEGHRKVKGIHYTPPLLAAYLAEQVVSGLKRSRTKFSELAIAHGIRRWGNEELRQMWRQDIDPQIVTLGLSVPSEDRGRLIR